MAPENLKQAENILKNALDLVPEKRTRYITEACAGDADLKRQVETLLTHHGGGALLDETLPITHSTDPGVPAYEDLDPMLGRLIGAYRIERELGRGGMGAVYEALRADNVFRKRVAIKVVKRGMDTDFILKRFRNERQILATLDHPNIARLLDGGTTDDGLPYFVMEYIEGRPLYQYCDDTCLNVDQRLQLFQPVCDAVNYAHQNQVVHRDIKPSNILVTSDGVPKLLDFGIAKLLDPELAAETIDLTLPAMRLMTPEYASPEQVRGDMVRPASDIYSMGVVLYELLSGRRPYRLKGRALHEVALIICEEEPVSLSASVSLESNLIHPQEDLTPVDLYEARNSDAESLRRALSGDIERIIMKALRKTPAERYQSAAELRDDIARHLLGEPVAAPPYVRRPARTQPPPAKTTADELSIAVLPFKLLGVQAKHDTGDEYLGIGLADALITRLSNVRRFVVRPTGSVLAYGTGDTGDPFTAGHDLDVEYIIDGNIRRGGDKLRVTVQLLEVRVGATRWASQFDEHYGDVLKLEDSISEQVAGALIPHLTGHEQQQLAKRGTYDVRAYEAYLRGRYHWHSMTEEGLAKSLRDYHRAIAYDPDYALAYAGIADYFIFLGIFGIMPFAESSAAAKQNALKAVELDDNLAEAHAALGFAIHCHDFDWHAAERHFLHAIEVNPHSINAHNWYSFILLSWGRFDEALAEVNQCLELDPVSAIVVASLGWCHYHARRYEQALEAHFKLRESDSRFAYGRMVDSWALRGLGRYDEAIEQAQKAIEIGGEGQLYVTCLGAAYAEAGRRDEAFEVIERLNEMSKSAYVSPYLMAFIYIYLGDADAAFGFLDKAIEMRDGWVIWFGVDPQLDPIRSDPRFGELLRRTKNPVRDGR
jgi:serine/threonine protein kinase/tetratricopeptide (TPR) repeat protein